MLHVLEVPTKANGVVEAVEDLARQPLDEEEQRDGAAGGEDDEEEERLGLGREQPPRGDDEVLATAARGLCDPDLEVTLQR